MTKPRCPLRLFEAIQMFRQAGLVSLLDGLWAGLVLLVAVWVRWAIACAHLAKIRVVAWAGLGAGLLCLARSSTTGVLLSPTRVLRWVSQTHSVSRIESLEVLCSIRVAVSVYRLSRNPVCFHKLVLSLQAASTDQAQVCLCQTCQSSFAAGPIEVATFKRFVTRTTTSILPALLLCWVACFPSLRCSPKAHLFLLEVCWSRFSTSRRCWSSWEILSWTDSIQLVDFSVLLAVGSHNQQVFTHRPPCTTLSLEAWLLMPWFSAKVTALRLTEQQCGSNQAKVSMDL